MIIVPASEIARGWLANDDRILVSISLEEVLALRLPNASCPRAGTGNALLLQA